MIRHFRKNRKMYIVACVTLCVSLYAFSPHSFFTFMAWILAAHINHTLGMHNYNFAAFLVLLQMAGAAAIVVFGVWKAVSFLEMTYKGISKGGRKRRR